MFPGVLIAVVAVGIAVDVVHAPVVPALERVAVAEIERDAVLQPQRPRNGVVLGKVPVQPGRIAFGGQVPVVVVLECIQESGVLEVDTCRRACKTQAAHVNKKAGLASINLP